MLFFNFFKKDPLTEALNERTIMIKKALVAVNKGAAIDYQNVCDRLKFNLESTAKDIPNKLKFTEMLDQLLFLASQLKEPKNASMKTVLAVHHIIDIAIHFNMPPSLDALQKSSHVAVKEKNNHTLTALNDYVTFYKLTPELKKIADMEEEEIRNMYNHTHSELTLYL